MFLIYKMDVSETRFVILELPCNQIERKVAKTSLEC